MRTAIYMRHAPDESAASHLTELREYAFAVGWEVGDLFVDEGRAGDEQPRDGLDALVLAATRGQIETVLTTELHRLARHQTLDLLTLLEKLTSAGVRVVATRDEIDTSEGIGRELIDAARYIKRIDAALARDRIMAGLDRARLSKGEAYHHGRRRVATTEEVVELHEQGLSNNQIARRLGVSQPTVMRRLREWRDGQRG